MSRLRRLVLSDRFFLFTCRLPRHRRPLEEPERECWARVVSERREKHHFLLPAWVLLPDRWHAGLVSRAQDWRWSSARDYSGSPSTAAILAIDRVRLPADDQARI